MSPGDNVPLKLPAADSSLYACFISYSTGRDYKLARELHSFLSGFAAEPAIRGFHVNARKFCLDGVTFRVPRRPPAANPPPALVLVSDVMRAIIRPHLQASDSLLLLCAGCDSLTPTMKWEMQEFLAQNRELGLDRSLWLAVTQGQDPSAAPAQFFGDELAAANVTSNLYFDFRGFRPESAKWDKVRNLEEEQLRLAAELYDVRDEAGRALSADDLSPAWQAS